ncbi:MAG: DUF2188 domain-containing protein [Acidobacteria bacterium]|nr:DUF2188 domain-containing protein [Acidobacteriota bacterium]
MPRTTVKVTPRDGGWEVRRGSSPNRPVYATKREAIRAARAIMKGIELGMILVYAPNGRIYSREHYGDPPIHRSRLRSSLGTAAIDAAIDAVMREQLGGD